MANQPLYMGFDLSTQQLKAIVIQSDLKLLHEAKVDFDADLGEKYEIQKGVQTHPEENEVFAPPAMWLEAVNLVLDRLREQGLDFSHVKALSGAGMQHGTVFWSSDGEKSLENLDSSKELVGQLEPGAFSHPTSPNWQDASTQKQCDAFDVELGSQEELARVTGSKAHHRFSGPQIMRFREKFPERYEKTARISLVSSFLASVLLGKVASIDISDVTGMNLWDIKKKAWCEKLLALTAGGEKHVSELKKKLGHVNEDGGASLGNISKYFVSRYGFPADCQIIPMTGDNPSTLLSLPLRPSDAMVSLGTSTTFLMSTPQFLPDPAYHFMNHPTTFGLQMFMLCYKNGGLAREKIRDALDPQSKSWEPFNQAAVNTPPLFQSSPSDDMRLGLYFPRPEIVPAVPAGQWRYAYSPNSSDPLSPLPSEPTLEADARTILESQFLSLRLRSHALVHPSETLNSSLPPQPGKIFLVGGGSANPAIAQLASEVLGGAEGVYVLDIGGNACALGAAYKAVWGKERREGEHFHDLIGARWDEKKFVRKVAEGYKKGVFEQYGKAVEGFRMMEEKVVGETKKSR